MIKLIYLFGIAFIGLLIFALIEYRTIDEVFFLDSYLIDNFIIPFILLAILTTSIFHYSQPEFKAIFIGEEKYWLSRLKLASRILITFPGLILCYHIITKSTISFINRKIGPQNEISLQGPIVEKYEMSSKKGTRQYIKIKNPHFPKPISVRVDEKFYRVTELGENYRIEANVGYLGYIYK